MKGKVSLKNNVSWDCDCMVFLGAVPAREAVSPPSPGLLDGLQLSHKEIRLLQKSHMSQHFKENIQDQVSELKQSELPLFSFILLLLLGKSVWFVVVEFIFSPKEQTYNCF